jgi:glycosyltransferase involved in cell wall biosynthesis
MKRKNSKVSIGLPVFNGEKYLRETIDSILAQTFTDFELIISDNASTDRTEEICKEYIGEDSRIRYYRNTANIGGGRNLSCTFALSKGEYFHTPGHDDVLAPNFLAKCVEVLDTKPTVVLCYSTIIEIDEENRHTGIVDYDIASSANAFERFRELTGDSHGCETAHGLLRASVFKKTGLHYNYPGGDKSFLSELSLHGKFHRIPESLFYKRLHTQSFGVGMYHDLPVAMSWFAPTSKEKIHNDSQLMLVRFRHYLSIISRAPLSFSERISCYLHVSLEPTRRIRHRLGIKRATLTSVKEVFSKVAKGSFIRNYL